MKYFLKDHEKDLANAKNPFPHFIKKVIALILAGILIVSTLLLLFYLRRKIYQGRNKPVGQLILV